MANKQFPIYVAKSKINGKGSFAAREIKGGETVNVFGGKEYSEKEVDYMIEKGILRMDDDFQIDNDKFLVGLGEDYFTNHSCDPNSGIKNVNQIVAIRDIKKDQEITIDYSTTSAPPRSGSLYRNDEWAMDCNCGSKNCRGKVGYILSLPKPIINRYLKLDVIPGFIKKSLYLK